MKRFHLSLRTLIGAVMAALFVFETAAVNAAEASLWAERRRAMNATRSQAPRAPDASDDSRDKKSTDGETLLAALPAIHPGLATLQTPEAGAAVLPTIDPVHVVPAWLQTAITPFATLQSAHLSTIPGSPTIIVMQDAHLHPEAQRNIADTIEALATDLSKRNDKLLVAMEGAAAGPVDYSGYAAGDPALRHEVSRAMIERRILSGAEAAAVATAGIRNGQDLFSTVGAENFAMYQANVDALRRTAPLRASADQALFDLRRELVDLKKKNFDEDLLRFDGRKAAYEDGKLGLPAYALYLDSVVPAQSANLRQLIEAALLEGSLKFNQVELERRRLLARLVEKMSEAEVKGLLQGSLMFRSSQISYADYYDLIRNLAARHGVPLSDFPEMNVYIQYVLKAESIDHRAVFAELAAQERVVQKKLASTDAQRELLALDSDLHLLKKLIDRSLIESEWHTYEARRPEIEKLLDRVAALGGSRPASAVDMAPHWKEFDDFYTSALSRNDAMTANLTDAASRAGAKYALIVAGGFHTDGLALLLEKKGFNVFVVSPHITSVGEGPSSLDFLAAGRLPLNELFVGEKLFLPTPPVTALQRLVGTTGRTVAALVTSLILGVVTALGSLRSALTSAEPVRLVRDGMVFTASREPANNGGLAFAFSDGSNVSVGEFTGAFEGGAFNRIIQAARVGAGMGGYEFGSFMLNLLRASGVNVSTNIRNSRELTQYVAGLLRPSTPAPRGARMPSTPGSRLADAIIQSGGLLNPYVEMLLLDYVRSLQYTPSWTHVNNVIESHQQLTPVADVPRDVTTALGTVQGQLGLSGLNVSIDLVSNDRTRTLSQVDVIAVGGQTRYVVRVSQEFLAQKIDGRIDAVVARAGFTNDAAGRAKARAWLLKQWATHELAEALLRRDTSTTDVGLRNQRDVHTLLVGNGFGLALPFNRADYTREPVLMLKDLIGRNTSAFAANASSRISATAQPAAVTATTGAVALPPVSTVGYDKALRREIKPGAVSEGFAMSRDGALLASTTGRSLNIIEAASGRVLATVPVTSAEAMKFSDDGRFLVIGNSIDEAFLVDLSNVAAPKVTPLDGHTDRVTAVNFFPDGNRALTAGWDRTVIEWDVATGKKLRTFTGQAGHILSVAYDAAGNVVAASPSEVRRWNAAGTQSTAVRLPDSIRNAASYTAAIALSPDTTKLAIQGANTLAILRTSDMEVLQRFDVRGDSVVSLAFSADGRQLVGSFTNFRDKSVVAAFDIADGVQPVVGKTAGTVDRVPPSQVIAELDTARTGKVAINNDGTSMGVALFHENTLQLNSRNVPQAATAPSRSVGSAGRVLGALLALAGLSAIGPSSASAAAPAIATSAAPFATATTLAVINPVMLSLGGLLLAVVGVVAAVLSWRNANQQGTAWRSRLFAVSAVILISSGIVSWGISQLERRQPPAPAPVAAPQGPAPKAQPPAVNPQQIKPATPAQPPVAPKVETPAPAQPVAPATVGVRPSLNWIKSQKLQGSALVGSYRVPAERDKTVDRIDPQAYDFLQGFGNTYDQAVAAIAAIRHGDAKDKDFAQGILDSFQDARQVPSKSNKEGEIISGEALWVGLAAVHYQTKYGEARYERLLAIIDDYVLKMVKDNGRVLGGPGKAWTSTEHNEDALAYLTARYVMTKGKGARQAAAFDEARTKVAQWMVSAYNDMGKAALPRGEKDRTLATDVQFWGVLSLSAVKRMDPTFYEKSGLPAIDFKTLLAAARRARATVDYKKPDGTVVSVTGYRYTTGADSPVSGEWTGEAVVAHDIAGQPDEALPLLQSLRRATFTDRDGNKSLPYAFSAGRTFRDGWTATPWPSVASTGWGIEAEQRGASNMFDALSPATAKAPATAPAPAAPKENKKQEAKRTTKAVTTKFQTWSGSGATSAYADGSFDFSDAEAVRFTFPKSQVGTLVRLRLLPKSSDPTSSDGATGNLYPVKADGDGGSIEVSVKDFGLTAQTLKTIKQVSVHSGSTDWFGAIKDKEGNPQDASKKARPTGVEKVLTGSTAYVGWARGAVVLAVTILATLAAFNGMGVHLSLGINAASLVSLVVIAAAVGVLRFTVGITPQIQRQVMAGAALALVSLPLGTVGLAGLLGLAATGLLIFVEEFTHLRSERAFGNTGAAFSLRELGVTGVNRTTEATTFFRGQAAFFVVGLIPFTAAGALFFGSLVAAPLMGGLVGLIAIFGLSFINKEGGAWRAAVLRGGLRAIGLRLPARVQIVVDRAMVGVEGGAIATSLTLASVTGVAALLLTNSVLVAFGAVLAAGALGLGIFYGVDALLDRLADRFSAWTGLGIAVGASFIVTGGLVLLIAPTWAAVLSAAAASVVALLVTTNRYGEGAFALPEFTTTGLFMLIFASTALLAAVIGGGISVGLITLGTVTAAPFFMFAAISGLISVGAVGVRGVEALRSRLAEARARREEERTFEPIDVPVQRGLSPHYHNIRAVGRRQQRNPDLRLTLKSTALPDTFDEAIPFYLALAAAYAESPQAAMNILNSAGTWVKGDPVWAAFHFYIREVLTNAESPTRGMDLHTLLRSLIRSPEGLRLNDRQRTLIVAAAILARRNNTDIQNDVADILSGTIRGEDLSDTAFGQVLRDVKVTLSPVAGRPKVFSLAQVVAASRAMSQAARALRRVFRLFRRSPLPPAYDAAASQIRAAYAARDLAGIVAGLRALQNAGTGRAMESMQDLGRALIQELDATGARPVDGSQPGLTNSLSNLLNVARREAAALAAEAYPYLRIMTPAARAQNEQRRRELADELVGLMLSQTDGGMFPVSVMEWFENRLDPASPVLAEANRYIDAASAASAARRRAARAARPAALVEEETAAPAAASPAAPAEEAAPATPASAAADAAPASEIDEAPAASEAPAAPAPAVVTDSVTSAPAPAAAAAAVSVTETTEAPAAPAAAATVVDTAVSVALHRLHELGLSPDLADDRLDAAAAVSRAEPLAALWAAFTKARPNASPMIEKELIQLRKAILFRADDFGRTAEQVIDALRDQAAEELNDVFAVNDSDVAAEIVFNAITAYRRGPVADLGEAAPVAVPFEQEALDWAAAVPGPFVPVRLNRTTKSAVVKINRSRVVAAVRAGIIVAILAASRPGSATASGLQFAPGKGIADLPPAAVAPLTAPLPPAPSDARLELRKLGYPISDDMAADKAAAVLPRARALAAVADRVRGNPALGVVVDQINRFVLENADAKDGPFLIAMVQLLNQLNEPALRVTAPRELRAAVEALKAIANQLLPKIGAELVTLEPSADVLERLPEGVDVAGRSALPSRFVVTAATAYGVRLQRPTGTVYPVRASVSVRSVGPTNPPTQPVPFTVENVRDHVRGVTIASVDHPTRNEDAQFNEVLPSGVLITGMFDGLGGESSVIKGRKINSDRASSLARDAVAARLRASLKGGETREQVEAILSQAFEDAIAAIGREFPTATIGTTAVVAVLLPQADGTTLTVTANVGDSRAWAIQSGRGRILTVDNLLPRDLGGRNNLVEGEIDSLRASRVRRLDALGRVTSQADLARDKDLKTKFDNRNQVSGALSPKSRSRPVFSAVNLWPGDRFVLTTDGIHDNLTDDEVFETIQAAGTAAEASEALVGRSVLRSEANGLRSKRDDMSALVVEIPEAPSAASAAAASPSVEATVAAFYNQRIPRIIADAILARPGVDPAGIVGLLADALYAARNAGATAVTGQLNIFLTRLNSIAMRANSNANLAEDLANAIAPILGLSDEIARLVLEQAGLTPDRTSPEYEKLDHELRALIPFFDRGTTSFDVELFQGDEHNDGQPLAFVQSYDGAAGKSVVIRITHAELARIRGRQTGGRLDLSPVPVVDRNGQTRLVPTLAALHQQRLLAQGIRISDQEASDLALRIFLLHELGEVGLDISDDALRLAGLADAGRLEALDAATGLRPETTHLSVDGIVGNLSAADHGPQALAQVRSPEQARTMRARELQALIILGAAHPILAQLFPNRQVLNYTLGLGDGNEVRYNADGTVDTTNFNVLQQSPTAMSRLAAMKAERQAGRTFTEMTSDQVDARFKLGDASTLAVWDERGGWKDQADRFDAFLKDPANAGKRHVFGVPQVGESDPNGNDLVTSLNAYVTMLQRKVRTSPELQPDVDKARQLRDAVVEHFTAMREGRDQNGRIGVVTLEPGDLALITQNAQGAYDMSAVVPIFQARAKALFGRDVQRVVFFSDWRQLVAASVNIAVETAMNANAFLSLEGRVEAANLVAIQA